MAVALLQGHVQRALEFYNKEGKYFVIGGTQAWTDDGNPSAPESTDYKLLDIVAYKKVDNCYLVIPDENGTIQYRTQNWSRVLPPYETTLTASVSAGSTVIQVNSLTGMTVGSKLRVGRSYEGTITAISGYEVTLDTAAPVSLLTGDIVEGGALVEGAKYVYIDCYLNYDRFPIMTYRQIGLCSGVTPNNEDILRSAEYSPTESNEFTNRGTLEILDNRVPSTRDIDQRELISLVIEM